MIDPKFFETDNLRRVAKWFYDEGREKTFIQEHLEAENPGQKIEIRNITKMLDKARNDGIIVIDFPESASPERRLANRLRDRFGHLEKVIVVKDQEQYGDLLTRWGEEAAKYFDELVAQGRPLHVGLSGGETLLSFVNAVTEYPREHVHIYTSALIGRGRLPDKASHVDPLVNATILWTKCGRLPGHCHYATVPPYDALTRNQIADELKALSERQPIREVIDDMNSINVAFAGLGLVKSNNPGLANQLTMTGLLEPIVTRETLLQEGAVGDLAYCFFDQQGGSKKAWDFFITAGYCDPARRGIAFFQQMVSDKKEKKKVIVMAGSFKQAAILPTLKAEAFNVWITDLHTAKSVLGEN